MLLLLRRRLLRLLSLWREPFCNTLPSILMLLLLLPLLLLLLLLLPR
jgi:hypothetical protein